MAGLAVVTPPPQIDLTNADRLRRALTAAAAEYPVVVMDMTANELWDSAGIRGLPRRALSEPGCLSGNRLRVSAADPGQYRGHGQVRVRQVLGSGR